MARKGRVSFPGCPHSYWHPIRGVLVLQPLPARRQVAEVVLKNNIRLNAGIWQG